MVVKFPDRNCMVVKLPATTVMNFFEKEKDRVPRVNEPWCSDYTRWFWVEKDGSLWVMDSEFANSKEYRELDAVCIVGSLIPRYDTNTGKFIGFNGSYSRWKGKIPPEVIAKFHGERVEVVGDG